MKADKRNLLKGMVIAVMVISLAGLFGSCGKKGADNSGDNTGNGSYVTISAEEAKEVMESEDEFVILDVRTPEEFSQGHIPGAILIPDYDIEKRAENEIEDKDKTLLVYCRSGNRSRGAAKALAQMGYTDVRDFGGIIDWPYDVEK